MSAPSPPPAPPADPAFAADLQDKLALAELWLMEGGLDRAARGRGLVAELRTASGSSPELAAALDAMLVRTRAASGQRLSKSLVGLGATLGRAVVAGGVVLLLFRMTFTDVEEGRFDAATLAQVPDRFVKLRLEAPPEEEEPVVQPVAIQVIKEAPPELVKDPEDAALPEPEAPSPVNPKGPAKSAADAARQLAEATQGGAAVGIVGVETGNQEVMGDIADAFGDVASAMDLETAAIKLGEADDAPKLGDGSASNAKKKAGGNALRNIGGSGKGATWVAQTEVTQREWTTVMGTDTLVTSGRWNLPVDQVSWCEAVRFANRKSAKEGLSKAYTVVGKCESGGEVRWDAAAMGYRLLTQAEFQKLAATGGVSRRVSLYQNNKDLVDVDADAVATPDGLKGLHDNAREWVWGGSGAAGGTLVHSGAASSATIVGCRSGSNPKSVCPAKASAGSRKLGVGLRVAKGPVRE